MLHNSITKDSLLLFVLKLTITYRLPKIEIKICSFFLLYYIMQNLLSRWELLLIRSSGPSGVGVVMGLLATTTPIGHWNNAAFNPDPYSLFTLILLLSSLLQYNIYKPNLTTGVARPSGAHGHRTEAPQSNGIFGVHLGWGAPAYCPPYPPACYAPDPNITSQSTVFIM